MAIPAWVVSIQCVAQVTLSPYSFYGLGEPIQAGSTRNYSMGSTGIGSFDGTTINRINPASYSDLRLTTIDFSGFGQYSIQKSNLNEGAVGTAGFHNVAMGFSNKKGYGFVAGLAPYSSAGYSVVTQDSIFADTAFKPYTETYTANGGLNQFYLGAGVRFLRHFHAGVNLTMAFGTTNLRTSTDFQDDVLSTVNVNQRVTVRGLLPQFGLQYGDTLRIRRELERAKVIDGEFKSLDQELAALEQEAATLVKENKKLESWTQKQQAELSAIETEKSAIDQQLEGLMNDEIGNEKSIQKLQERAYRLEKQRKKIQREVKTRRRTLDDAQSRIESRKIKIQERKAALEKELSEIKAGKRPATEIKRQALILRGGAIAEPGTTLNGDRLVSFNNSSVTDTFSLQEGGIRMPAKWGLGFSVVRPGRWTLAADVVYNDWSGFDYFGDANTLSNSFDLRAGGEWIPDLLSRNFAKRIAYRVGFFSQGAFLTVDGQPIQETGITFGLGLPIGRLSATGQNFSRINLGFGVSRRGTQDANLLQETNFHMRVGVNLNDIWFIKRKID